MVPGRSTPWPPGVWRRFWCSEASGWSTGDRASALWENSPAPRWRQAGVRVSALAQAVIEIRVLQASTRRTLLSDTFSGIGIGITNAFLLRQAARVALQRAAVRISNL